MISPARCRMIALALVMSALARGASADTVLLKNGRKMTADSVRVEGDHLVLETAAGTITIPREDVKSIEKTPAGAGTEGPRRKASPTPAASTSGRTPVDGPTETDWLVQGVEALKARRFDRAQSCFLAALAADPRSTTAGLGAAAAQLGMGDPAGAAERARVIVANEPGSSEGWLILGQALYETGDVEGARRAIEKSRSLLAPAAGRPGGSGPAGAETGPPRQDPARVLGFGPEELSGWIERLEKEESASAGYGSLWSGHFRLDFDAGRAPQRARESLAFLDSIYEEMARTFRHHPSASLTVILHGRDSFHELTGTGNEVLGLYDGKIRIPTGGTDHLRDMDRMTLRHELAHAFIDAKTAGRCPHWLHEGLAQRVEPQSSRGTEAQLARLGAPEAALEGRFTYGSALGFVDYLEARFGADRMNILLDRLAEEPIDEACRWAFGAPYADLVGDWGKALRSRATR